MKRRRVEGMAVLKKMKLSREERKAIVAAIRDLAESEDPTEVSEPVRELQVGTDKCPDCGAVLNLVSAGITLPGGGKIDFFDCDRCDKPFAMQAQ